MMLGGLTQHDVAIATDEEGECESQLTSTTELAEEEKEDERYEEQVEQHGGERVWLKG